MGNPSPRIPWATPANTKTSPATSQREVLRSPGSKREASYRSARAPSGRGLRQLAKHGLGVVPGHAGIGNTLPVDEPGSGAQVLAAGDQVPTDAPLGRIAMLPELVDKYGRY